MTPRRLSELPTGARCRLVRIDLPGPLAQRLMEQGFVPGVSLSVARSAPSGDPRVYRVDGVEIALRNDTAGGLAVETEEPLEEPA